jgi:hypothetical protein
MGAAVRQISGPIAVYIYIYIYIYRNIYRYGGSSEADKRPDSSPPGIRVRMCDAAGFTQLYHYTYYCKQHARLSCGKLGAKSVVGFTQL